MGLPLENYTANLPRPFPHGYQPDPKECPWALYLAWESSDKNSGLDVPKAAGINIQKNHPGITPCTRETIKNDKYAMCGVIRLRCEASGHETFVHRCVVLKQSKWLKDRADLSNSDDEVLVHIPKHIRWWQVAWALGYMYEGRVPGFHLLAGEQWPLKYPHRQSRSIAWGFFELWEAAHFFGLDGLENRALGAFNEHFAIGIGDAIRSHRETQALGGSGGSVGGGTLVAWSERRIAFEFGQAALRIFGDPSVIPQDYFSMYMTAYGHGYTSSFAQDEDAIRGWESAIFDRTRAPVVEGAGLPTEYLSDGPMPQYRNAFKSEMVELCMEIAWSGLFELRWFQGFMSRNNLTCPVGFRTALKEGMEASLDRWPSEKYPDAPNSFRRRTASDGDEQQ